MFRDTHHGKPCHYCERTMSSRDGRLHPTRDHVIPVSRGSGRGTVACCVTCNGIKADMLPDVWEAFMAAHPGWWKLSKIELRDIRRSALGLTTIRRLRRIRSVRPKPVVVPPELIFTERSIT